MPRNFLYNYLSHCGLASNTLPQEQRIPEFDPRHRQIMVQMATQNGSPKSLGSISSGRLEIPGGIGK